MNGSGRTRQDWRREWLIVGALCLGAEGIMGLWAWALGEVWAAWLCAGLGALVAVCWGLHWWAWWRARRRGPRVWRGC
jgi:hypothetical protein